MSLVEDSPTLAESGGGPFAILAMRLGGLLEDYGGSKDEAALTQLALVRDLSSARDGHDRFPRAGKC